MAETKRALKADGAEGPETVEVKTDSLDKVAIAIQSMVAANQAKSLPHHGPAPTDEHGNVIAPHCSYFDRDGKEYPCVIEGGKFNPRSWPTKGEDPMSTTGIKNTGHCIAFYVRVNFKVKNADNWLPVCGVYNKKDQRNGYKKAYIVLTPDLEKLYTINFSSEKKVILPLPPGITM